MDTTGISGARQLQQILRGLTKQSNRGQTSTPAGWTRTQAPTAPGVVIEHPSDWRGSLVATTNVGSVMYAQGRVTSGDGRSLLEGETMNLTTPLPSAQIAQAQVDRWVRQLGARAMILSDDWQDPLPGGLMLVNMSLRAIDTGDFIVFVIGTSVPNIAMERTGYSIGSVGYKVIIGPKATFTQLTSQVYLPMLLSTNW
ncbi:MAG: hypothetical protein JNK67_02075 [Alphaproteobacteria bacterium]|nr:hypothetical protein [Alphaproteobacteria bacterium]